MGLKFLRPYIVSLLSFIIMTFPAHGSIEHILISDLTGSLRSFQGDIYSEHIHLGLGPTRLDFHDFHGIVFKENNQLTLSQKNTNLVLDDFNSSSFDFLEDIDVQSVDFQWRRNRNIFMAFRSAHIKMGEGLQQFEHFKANCQSLSEQYDTQDFLLPCLEKGRFSIPLINIDELTQKQVTKTLLTKELQSFLSTSGYKVNEATPEFVTPRRIRDVSITTNRGSFNLRAKARIIFNLTVRVDGDINYHKDSRVMTIDIDRANIGIISIKRSLLNTLRDNGLDIRGDRIIIPL